MDTMMALQEAVAGRYAIQRELGRGGMGIVYLAWETALDRPVALKILPPAVATERSRTRFLREASVAAGLEHDHILPIFAVERAGPFVYYTMRYVAGRTLAERVLEEGPLPVGEATRILRDVARAVHYAHERGVVHRDLKPQNILLERTEDCERAYVTDFGIARVMGDGPPPDGVDPTFGTHAYASPEQVAGRPVDRRSDIYSLGVVGYVTAAGRAPFAGTRRSIMEAHLRQTAPRLEVLNRHLDPTLTRAVARCLAKDPAERFQSADELARALDLAPELASELQPPLAEFVSALRFQSRSTPAALLLGAVAAGVGGKALLGGAWETASAALGFLALVLASPAISAIPATRRLIEQGYGLKDIVHVLKRDRDRQREALAGRWGRATDTPDKWWRGVAAGGFVLFLAGAAAAGLAPNLPTAPVFWSMFAGAFTALAGGVVILRRERRRNELWGRRWLRFWESRLGEWTVKVAGVGLGPALPEPALPEPARHPAAGVPALDDIVERSEASVRRGRVYLAASSATRTRERRDPTAEELERQDTLERQLAALEAVLANLMAADAAGLKDGSLTADLEAAGELRAMVEALLEVNEPGQESGA